MTDEELIEKLDGLEKKVYALVLTCKSQQKQLDAAIEENIQLKETIEGQKQQLNNFQNQENFNKIVNSIIAGSENKAETRKRLNEYIEHLDKCIAFLSK